MSFIEIVDQVIELLQNRGRVTYRALKREFNLDDELLKDLKEELIEGQRVAVDENGKVLAWVSGGEESENQRSGKPGKGAEEQHSIQTLDPRRQTRDPSQRGSEAERRQLTVLFCDLVGSMALSEQFDPEELREVVRAYQQASAEVVARYEGYIAQYLGDGLLVYFGYPTAHEDDAARAVRAGLEIVAALQKWIPSPFQGRARAMQVRIGIHTGQVVVGEMGGGGRHEQLALGNTPNIAARVQGQAEPGSVVMSAATYQLVQGLFECHDLGPQVLKGLSTPLSLYRVVGASAAQSRFEVAIRTGLTPLVGREPELEFLRAHWEQTKAGAGRVVLLSGEPGIGKSRLVQEFKDQLEHERVTRIEFRCSPYHQNSALYSIIDYLQRLLQFEREDSPAAKLKKLQHTLSHCHFPQADTVPLLATLLSLPHPEGYPPLTVSPQKQKERMHAALVAWLVEEAEQQPVYNTWEDVHWADPSTLEVLNLVVDQAPTACLYVLLTFRPEFIPPWNNRSHLRQLTLSRLERTQTEAMVERVTGGKPLPAEVVQQIVAKTDGVPLFVEEVTKSVLESVGALREAPLLGIPATLHDALMARLDRLGTAREIAQLGATIGREFSYELLQAVSPLDEEVLQQGLKQVVASELVYQRGISPQAHYLFKHALIQDTAYQSLLRSTRQQYHRQIARVLERRFTETVETQPELVAHHYTEAGLVEQALPYWQRAGERATQRSAYVEAVAHLTRGLEVLKALPDTLERTHQELTLQLALRDALVVVSGYTAPEVEKTVLRARELCQQVGETPQLFPVLFRLWGFYINRGELQTPRELAKQLMRLAQSAQDRYLLSVAHMALGCTLFWLGELTSARTLLEQAIALYDPQTHPRPTVNTADPRVDCLSYAAWTLWALGYPDQALERSHEAVALAKGLSHSFSLTYALGISAVFHSLRREWQIARERAEAVITLSTEQGFPYWLTYGTMVRGWALTEQGQVEEGIAQLQQGLAAFRAGGTETARISTLTMLAAAYGRVGQEEEGLSVLAEALALVDKTGAREHEAGLYRLAGELSLRTGEPERGRSGDGEPPPSYSPFPRFPDSPIHSHIPRFPDSSPEACFQKALEVARRQSAKSMELRAATSLARLWQQQGKKAEACQLLSEVYNWFTEGFNTKDLQEAKELLDKLSCSKSSSLT